MKKHTKLALRRTAIRILDNTQLAASGGGPVLALQTFTCNFCPPTPTKHPESCIIVCTLPGTVVQTANC